MHFASSDSTSSFHVSWKSSRSALLCRATCNCGWRLWQIWELWCWSWCLDSQSSHGAFGLRKTPKNIQILGLSWIWLLQTKWLTLNWKQLKFHVVRLCSIYPDPSGLHVLMLVYFSIFCFQRPSCFAKAIESETGSSETESSSQTLQNELSA